MYFCRHYHTPNIPTFAGVETFSGRTVHSHDYRKPDDFKGLSVVVVGAGPSGLDIALDISAAAKQVRGLFFSEVHRSGFKYQHSGLETALRGTE